MTIIKTKRGTILAIGIMLTGLIYIGFVSFKSASGIKSSNRIIDSADTNITLVGGIDLPRGYKRVDLDAESMGFYLRNMAIKKDKTVYLYNGQSKRNQSAQFAVLDIDIGRRDLQQCADAVMRLRAEYLWLNNNKDQITFNFTSGHEAKWTKYAQGYRAVISGSKVTWQLKAKPDSTYANFRKYLNLVFSYCGTASLYRDAPKTKAFTLEPGDFLLQKGNPYGHAVIIMDMAVNQAGEKLYLLAQSYMPAQNIHILNNPANDASPWYVLMDGEQIVTPEWRFPADSFRTW